MSKYAKILDQLATKERRQTDALEATRAHIAAIEKLELTEGQTEMPFEGTKPKK